MNRPRAAALLLSVGLVAGCGSGKPAAVPLCTTAGIAVTLEQAQNAATIAAVGKRMGLPDHAVTIALATALQESGLRNLPYGDRDSLGLFQQRPSQGWGTVAQVRDPVHASNAFYDALVKIQGYQTLPITQVAQRVQHSAYPQAYAEHELEARAYASALSGSSPAALTCDLGTDAVPSGAAGVVPFTRALAREQLAVRATPMAGVVGVRLTAPTSTTAWSLAQWSVASSGRLGVARVYVDGRMWSRATPSAWSPTTDAAALAGPGRTGVLVMFSDTGPTPSR